MPLSADHPLHAADAERSRARLADIELGLSDSEDAWIYREKLAHRIRALEEDEALYGLIGHEAAELEALNALRQRDRSQSRHEAGDQGRGFHCFSPPLPSHSSEANDA